VAQAFCCVTARNQTVWWCWNFPQAETKLLSVSMRTQKAVPSTHTKLTHKCGYFWLTYVFNLSWIDTQWQQYITHLHTKSKHTTEKGKLGCAGRASSLRIIPWHLPQNWVKSTEKPHLG
jgi:hypothetical protein